MKKLSLLLFIVLIAMATALSGCGVLIEPSSWPGITVNEDTAFVAYGPHVYALQLRNGNQRWQFPDEAESTINYYAAPVLSEDGQIIIASYSRGGINGNDVFGLDAGNGRLNWNFDGANNRYISSPLISNGKIFAPNANNSIYKLDLDGSTYSNWTFSAEEPLWAQPLELGESMIVAAMDHHVYSIDMQNGDPEWVSVDLGSAMASSPAYGENGYLYVGTFGSNMYALDSSDGDIIWSFETEDWVWTTPALSNGKLFFGDQSGTIFVLDENTGKEIWRMETDGSIMGTPLIIDEQIYFATESGSVYVLSPNGSNDWEYDIIKEIEGRVLGPLVQAGDLILISVVEADEIVIAIDLSGNQQWSFTPDN